MTRLRFNNVLSPPSSTPPAGSNPVTISSAGAGTATWTSAPSFPTITAPDYTVLVVEPGTANLDIRYITAYTSGATSATVTGPQEGSTGSTHGGVGVAWQHGPTALDFGNGLAIFGDGSDGSPTFDGTTTILGMAPSSGVYTMARDLFLASPTINSGVTIVTNGFRLFVSGTLTNNGTIGWTGNTGGNGTTVGGAAGAALSSANSPFNSGTVGVAGAAGATGAGANGGSAAARSYGGAAGHGGSGSSGGGGSGGTVTAPTANQGSIRSVPTALITALFNQGTWLGAQGGAGAGSGGGDSTNAGGGGGSGGGIVVVAARFITGTGTISANGGNGGNGNGTGNTGGGGGGGGGLLIVVSSSVVNSGGTSAISGQTTTANGGTHGTSNGSGGAAITNGSAGTVILIPN